MVRKGFTLGMAALAVAVVVPVSVAGAVSAKPTTTRTAAGQVEHFTGMSTNGNSSTSTVIATGAFTDGGKDHVLSNNKDRFVFPTGSFVVTHHGKQHITFNGKKCLLSGTGHGT